MMGHNSMPALAEHQFFAAAHAAVQKFDEGGRSQRDAIIDLIRAFWQHGTLAFGTVDQGFDYMADKKIKFATDWSQQERDAIVWIIKSGETFTGPDGLQTNGLIETWVRDFKARRTANSFRQGYTSTTKTQVKKRITSGELPADVAKDIKDSGLFSDDWVANTIKKATTATEPKTDEQYRDQVINAAKREGGMGAMIELIRTEGALEKAIADARAEDEQKAEEKRLEAEHKEATKGMNPGQLRRYQEQQRKIAAAIVEAEENAGEYDDF